MSFEVTTTSPQLHICDKTPGKPGVPSYLVELGTKALTERVAGLCSDATKKLGLEKVPPSRSTKAAGSSQLFTACTWQLHPEQPALVSAG